MRAAWPLEKIEARLRSPRRARRCVLLTTGALNPVHLGHVAMLDKARIGLESEFGLEVVGGFLSPSHDLYLQAKHHDDTAFYPAARRLALCEAATRDHPYLSVGSWESALPDRWPDFPEVVAALGETLRERFPCESLQVVYVCGEDHARIARHTDLPGLCIVARAGRAGVTDRGRAIFAVASTGEDAFSHTSATRIREALASGDRATLEADLHPAVLAMLTGQG